MTMKNKTTIKSLRAGFQIKFKNEYTLSVGIGRKHYCDNHNIGDLNDEKQLPTSTMEVAIIDPSGKFAILPDDVVGWLPVEWLPDLIEAVEDEEWAAVRRIVSTWE
jgi:hypothetical protein